MSDILIKGMEMPESCDKCRIMVFEDTNCLPELFCGCPIVFKAHPQGVGHRPDWCPLIEIPHHGRLIDADALDTGILQAGFSYALTRRKLRYTPGDVRQKIANAPTIIEAEDGE